MPTLSGMEWLNLVAFLLTAAGVAIAVLQTYRAETAKRNLIRERRARNAAIWHNIAMVLNAYDTLEDARQHAKAVASRESLEVLAAKVASARRCVVDQYLDLLRSAVLDEEEFTEATLERWVAQGRLQNDWRIQQARKFIR